MSDVRRELFERVVEAVSRRDWDALEELHHPDVVHDVPQARERVRGFANVRKILENYPRGVAGEHIAGARLIAEERWAVTPTFTVGARRGSRGSATTKRSRAQRRPPVAESACARVERMDDRP